MSASVVPVSIAVVVVLAREIATAARTARHGRALLRETADYLEDWSNALELIPDTSSSTLQPFVERCEASLRDLQVVLMKAESLNNFQYLIHARAVTASVHGITATLRARLQDLQIGMSAELLAQQAEILAKLQDPEELLEDDDSQEELKKVETILDTSDDTEKKQKLTQEAGIQNQTELYTFFEDAKKERRGWRQVLASSARAVVKTVARTMLLLLKRLVPVVRDIVLIGQVPVNSQTKLALASANVVKQTVGSQNYWTLDSLTYKV